MKKAGKISRAGKIWLIVGVFLVVIGILVRQLDIGNWQKLDLNKLTQLKQTTVVFASDDTPIGNLYGTENRVLVRLEEVPEKVQNAFIAAEDQRFYQHRGVDPVRIFGALWHDIKTGTLAQGASTITQQLIKLTHLTSEKTFSRKAQEMWLAWQLEREMDKEEILECYLNVVYFGNGAYGIGVAAEKYFEKDVQELTLAEGALLAGVIKSPTNYAPHTQPENAIKRRNLILDNMAEYGLISEQDAQNAKTETLSLAQQKRTSTDYDWYIDEVYKEAQTLVGMDADGLLTGGYRIYTALDRSAQTEAEALFDDGTNFPDAAPDGTPAQSALVAMDVRSGEIVALVGGRSYDVRMGLNRATQITRQPGSAIKPVSTYAAAIETRKYLPSSFLSDEEKTFAGGYTPGNADGKFHGIVTLREALSRSLNVATVNLADAVGIAGVRNQIVRFGIPLNDRDANLALSLGSMTDGVSPAELCQAYCALANGGTRVEGHCIRRIEAADGEILYAAQEPAGRAVSAETAYMITDILRTAASAGSAKALKSVDAQVGAKTGTVGMETEGNRDAWTIAYTPRLAVAVWMGFDQPDAAHKLPDWVGGSSYPAQLCAKFLSGTGSQWLAGDFVMPYTLRRVLVDTLAVQQDQIVTLATARTPRTYIEAEIFYADAVPETVSAKWDVPQAVYDLQLVSKPGQTPVLSFTALDENVEYLLLRTSRGETDLLATLRGKAGQQVEYVDESADLAQEYEYSIIPRHALLYELGSLVTGTESTPVSYGPGGLAGHITNLLKPDAGADAPEVEVDPDQSLFG